jgi:hypothetical protein
MTLDQLQTMQIIRGRRVSGFEDVDKGISKGVPGRPTSRDMEHHQPLVASPSLPGSDPKPASLGTEVVNSGGNSNGSNGNVEILSQSATLPSAPSSSFNPNPNSSSSSGTFYPTPKAPSTVSTYTTRAVEHVQNAPPPQPVRNMTGNYPLSLSLSLSSTPSY